MQQLGSCRKAIEAGAGVLAIGVLEVVTESTDLAAWLEQLVPAPLVPLVPVVLGGIALTARVWRYPNTATSVPAPNLEAPAPVDSLLASSAPGQALASAVTAATPPTADAVTEAADAPTPAPELPQLRDPAAAAAWSASVGITAPTGEPAAVEPTNPPTSFIPLPR